MNFLNYFIIKLLVNVKFANIINIINNSEVIPELLQSKCNAKDIYHLFSSFLNNPDLGKKQVLEYKKVLSEIKLASSPSDKVANILNDNLN